MPQASFRTWLGVAKDTINANLQIAHTGGATTLTLRSITSTATGTLTSAGATYSVVIVDGVNTETKVLTGNLTAVTDGSTVAVTALTNAHSANAYAYFQVTASIGPTAYIPMSKLDWADDIDQLKDMNLRGSNTDVYGVAQGMRRATLSVAGDVFADSFGYLCGDLFGAYDYTGTSGGNPSTYAFSQLNTGNAQPNQYLYYYYNPANNNTRVLAQSQVSDITVKVDPGVLIGHTSTIMGYASGVVANPATIPPAYSTFTTVPGRVATATIGGTLNYKVASYELSLKRAEFGPIETLQGIQDPIDIFAGPLQCTVKSTLIVDDDVQFLNYLNASQPSFLLTGQPGRHNGGQRPQDPEHQGQLRGDQIRRHGWQGLGDARGGLHGYRQLNRQVDGRRWALTVSADRLDRNSDRSHPLLMKIDLPHDNWAMVREPDEIPRRAARNFRKVLYRLAGPAANETDAAAAATALLQAEGGLDGIEDMADALVFAVVAEWSYGHVDAATLDEVPDAAVDAIYQHAIAGGYMEKLMPDFGVSPDDDSPTGPSGR